MYGKTMSAAAILTTLVMVSPANAEKIAMKLNLSGASEVPPNDSKATGTADVNYDTASKMLTWKVTYSGLTGPATMAHFHGPAEPGKNAGIMIPFKDVASGAQGSATLTDTQATDLMAGKMYINVHTAAHPGGEIRAQVVK
ncbi:chrd [Afipia carboxidovorans OM5]|uniref:CHRD family protein n=1 Tax=Afipia carboxidovorans (strain ATCC 49405 / DSM 1227 / KCTC 32145 / OM5) TaxID=504832 RepID=B6JBD3_AFIC5|nr:CHRD domain-containing protein [Afipia carboxidovorans]ACI92474.1 chrd [Afipia carboxidovorans OM5]AEI03752.1 CHRD family protein [Afipia carboxidovorans OM4]AEI07329.1 CHRD family protein [Afipia carboxidovorans OM5]BEV44860.1 CHRD domain-containing protein [Afipia carboxidovorans]